MVNNANKRLKRNAGLSLIEIAIAMIVIGLLMIPVIQNYNQYVVDRLNGDTSISISAIQTGLQNFYYANNRLPCPADPTLALTNAAAGNEDCAGSTARATAATVQVGAVPFSAINIPASSTLDGWLNKITYTVTKANTTAPLDPAVKAITINALDSAGNPAAPVLAPYALVSHGSDGLGAYNGNGIKVGNCPAGGTPPREAQNCDNNDVFFSNVNARSLVPGVNYLDDVVAYTTGLATVIWAYVPGQYSNIFSSGYVGIKNTDPQDPLDVNGNVKVGNAYAVDPTTKGTITLPVGQEPQGFCSSGVPELDAQNKTIGYTYSCFPTQIIAGNGMGGDVSGLGCFSTGSGASAQSSFMTGIARADAVCSASYISGHPFTCPSGKYVQKIDAGGNPTCGP